MVAMAEVDSDPEDAVVGSSLNAIAIESSLEDPATGAGLKDVTAGYGQDAAIASG